ncbi:MAG: glycerol-3-phosphate 1-O-acyltransferase PlsY [Candidatus Lustribacter sp.]
MTILADAALVVAAFFIGAIPFGIVVSRLFFRRDLRAEGSGNIGAANALRSLGKGGAIAVLVLDGLKGALPVVAGRALDGPALAAVAAFAAIAGHCFSPFLGFRGGKGVATHFGAVIAFAWPAGAIFAAVWLAVVLVTGYSSAGSLLATLAMIPALWLWAGPTAGLYAVAAALLITYMHRGNIARLRAGTESVLPLFRTVKGRPPA